MTEAGYFDELARLRPELHDALSQEDACYTPNLAPMTIRAGALADALRCNIGSFTQEDLAAVFAICETAIDEGATEAAAMATGFLEGLQHSAGCDAFDFSNVAPFLGKQSRAHCVAMDRFHGVMTPGL